MAVTHGESNSHLYKMWQQLKENSRPHLQDFEVFDEWKNSYESFAEYARSIGYSEEVNRHMHRHNLEVGYVPGNIYFKDYRSRVGRVLLYDGVSKSVRDWARVTGIKHSTLKTRLKKGWTIGQALGFEPRNKKGD